MWCQRCVRKFRFDSKHVCVFSDDSKRSKCEFCNKNFHYCERDNALYKLQDNVRIFAVKSSDNLKLIFQHWKDNSIRFLMHNVTNMKQNDIEKIRCFLSRFFLARLRWLSRQSSLRKRFSCLSFFFFRLFLFLLEKKLESFLFRFSTLASVSLADFAASASQTNSFVVASVFASQLLLFLLFESFTFFQL